MPLFRPGGGKSTRRGFPGSIPRTRNEIWAEEEDRSFTLSSVVLHSRCATSCQGVTASVCAYAVVGFVPLDGSPMVVVHSRCIVQSPAAPHRKISASLSSENTRAAVTSRGSGRSPREVSTSWNEARILEFRAWRTSSRIFWLAFAAIGTSFLQYRPKRALRLANSTPANVLFQGLAGYAASTIPSTRSTGSRACMLSHMTVCSPRNL